MSTKLAVTRYLNMLSTASDREYCLHLSYVHKMQKRHNLSHEKAIERYMDKYNNPDNVSFDTIAKKLNLTRSEVYKSYSSGMRKIKKILIEKYKIDENYMREHFY